MTSLSGVSASAARTSVSAGRRSVPAWRPTIGELEDPHPVPGAQGSNVSCATLVQQAEAATASEGRHDRSCSSPAVPPTLRAGAATARVPCLSCTDLESAEATASAIVTGDESFARASMVRSRPHPVARGRLRNRIWEIGNEINGNWLDTTSGGVPTLSGR